MAFFEITRSVPAGVQECWRRVTDWPRHSAMVPLTRVAQVGAGPTGLGSTVLARTAVGPLGFDDPMEVVLWQPPTAHAPGRVRLEKRGSVVLGWAEVEVRAEGPGSVVRWREEIRVRGVPAPLDAVVAGTGRRVFGRVVDGLLRGQDL
ncbi:SRPBCC family protein [Streptacidiphilus sp. PB12-B1b]|uniref:SRPBCC family protein n=1 Tax=Streptacidiphilus sp. PB12-B1b TaxID=2705012 RepID=UPI0015FC6572|nr:SRPBCC family protein [Streptacidiphilus sp. PB12-B1b]QMU77814.1 SRPBCC family protein [Streptacidiphilus sp. PB12-B1b]